MSITDLLVPRELSPDERLYDFYSIYFDDDDNSPRQFYESFHGRFDDEHFIPQQHRDTHSVTHFRFHPLYLYLDRAFGKEFRDSIDGIVANALLPWVAEAIEDIPQGRERSLKKGYSWDWKNKQLQGVKVLIGNMKKFDHGRMFFNIDDKQVEALRETREQRGISIEYGVSEISDLVCVVHAGDENFRLIDFTITPRAELEKEDRVYPGHEVRYYGISGVPHQLNQLEKGFAYLEILGEDGHSSGLSIKYDDAENQRLRFTRHERKPERAVLTQDSRIYKIHGLTPQLDELEKVFASLETLGLQKSQSHIVIGYDGDGSARMSFSRVDNVPLTFPDELLTYYQGWYQGEEGGRDLSAEEFKSLIREHGSGSWKDSSGNSVQIRHEYNDGEGSSALLVLGRDTGVEGKFHRKNEAGHYIID